MVYYVNVPSRLVVQTGKDCSWRSDAGELDSQMVIAVPALQSSSIAVILYSKEIERNVASRRMSLDVEKMMFVEN